MATHVLTEKEYKETMTSGMTSAISNDGPAIDIWPYVEHLTEDDTVSEFVSSNKLVGQVYRNNDATFDHVLLPANDENVFVVVIVDLKERNVYGHYLLNLNREYER